MLNVCVAVFTAVVCVKGKRPGSSATLKWLVYADDGGLTAQTVK